MSREGDALRLKVLRMCFEAGSGHLGGSFSCAELMHVLYGDILHVDPLRPDEPGRDRFILSKGHAAPMLYAALSGCGFFLEETLYTLRDLGSPLQGHPCMFKLKGIDLSTGSLGLGLSAGVGMALALKDSYPQAHIYVLLGDGELQEGQNWEAFMSLKAFGITSVTPIIDYNGVQLDGPTCNIQPNQATIADKLRGFGLELFGADGHDELSLRGVLVQAKQCGAPHAVILQTIKGKGVSFMEGRSAWHGKSLTRDEYAQARAEIEARWEQ